MMISPHVIDVSIGKPMEIFTAPSYYTEAKLLEALGLEKGCRGDVMALLAPQSQRGNEKYSKSMLLVRTGPKELRIVGAIAYDFSECKDFAILQTETELISKAESYAAHLMSVDPDHSRQVDRYKCKATERYWECSDRLERMQRRCR